MGSLLFKLYLLITDGIQGHRHLGKFVLLEVALLALFFGVAYNESISVYIAALLGLLTFIVTPGIILLSLKDKWYIKSSSAAIQDSQGRTSWVSGFYSGRSNRASYLVGIISVNTILAVMYYVYNREIVQPLLTGNQITSTVFWLYSVSLLMLSIPVVIYKIRLEVRRLHDMGRPGRWLSSIYGIVLLMSYVNADAAYYGGIIVSLVLGVKSGDVESNDFGEPPPKGIRFPHDLVGR